MSKVFTIAEGLENLGALKTGGQGSIYRGKRIGPIITAVKLLPTPIMSEDTSDKHYRDFVNEVEKLKRVNEMPNPNVVRILNSGISETGSFPFIEMEFIEGPDLEELLKPPHDTVFTIKETIRVAEHLASALAHCHRVDVKHGDIKSNNVKYNQHTGNYVLLDFGLAMMSDEQRRTSLRHAGAIEFMAPEQSDGQMLLQTDVYSYGVILYELLAGRVPFPLEHKSETARNTVLVAHMEAEPPAILPLRAEHMPAAWPDDRKEHEMAVPHWLLDMIQKCLSKKPEDRFGNGMALYEHVLRHSTAAAVPGASVDSRIVQLRDENKKLADEVRSLRGQLQQAAKVAAAAPVAAQAGPQQPYYAERPPEKNRLLLPIIFGLIAVAAIGYALWERNRSADTEMGVSISDTSAADELDPGALSRQEEEEADRGPDTVVVREPLPTMIDTATQSPQSAAGADDPPINAEEPKADPKPPTRSNNRYLVVAGRAYFHNEPNAGSRRDAYLTPSDEVMTAIEERGDYVYVVFTNRDGVTSRGWVLKNDLSPIE